MTASIDPELLGLTLSGLKAVANAKTSERADARLFRLCTRAVRSEQRIEAMFAAVQLMRDLDQIDRAEGAFVLWALFDRLLWREVSKGKPRPGLRRALREGGDLELIFAAMRDRETVRASAFLREHGEEELAEMVVNQPDEYQALWIDGEGTLVDAKPPEERPAEPATAPAGPQVFSESILAVLATETFKEWLPAWEALCDASDAGAPPEAVAATHGVRGVRALW